MVVPEPEQHNDPADDTRDLDAANRLRRGRAAALTPGERIERVAELIKQAQKLAPADRPPSR